MTCPLINICCFRSFAHIKVNMNSLDLAIDDATMGLHIISRYTKALRYSKGTGLRSFDFLLKFHAGWFTTSSQSAVFQGDLGGALVDTRASRVVSNTCETAEDTFHQLGSSLHLIVSILAPMKCRMQCPHYTPHENREWCKELLIGDYSLRNSLCSHCCQCPQLPGTSRYLT
jgi:hypothetical protein